MNILKITKTQFFELEQLRKQLQNPTKAVLCMCEKCEGVGFAYDKSQIDANGYVVGGMNCPCGGHNKKVDKVEII